MIGHLLFELLRIVYFREFLILRANFDEIEKIRKMDLLYDGAYLLSKFGQNRSSRYRDIAGTKTLRTDVRTDVRTYLHTAQSTGELRALVTLCLL